MKNRTQMVFLLALILLMPRWSAAAQPGSPPELSQVKGWFGRNVMLTSRGTWERVYPEKQGDKTQLVISESSDWGESWSEPKTLCDLPGEGWGGTAALRTRDGELQVFMVKGRKIGEGKRPAIDRFIDLWQLHSSEGVTRWSEPKCLYEGWLGSISNAIQLDNGRIVMPFGMSIGGRVAGPPTGRHELTVVYSDDNGQTYTMSPARLTSPCYADYNGSNEGACEPAAVQLKDGRVLMFMRTQTGFLYESISKDGSDWPAATASRLHSSTGPPYLIRLKDDRIVLFWNNCEMPPRVDKQLVYGGRDALHAAIADPELKSWRGFREIYRDPNRNATPPKRGDRGTAYPDAVAMPDGRIGVSSGQGGLRALMRIDPEWLYQTQQSDDFSTGLDGWSVFKAFGPASRAWRDRTQGAQLIDHPSKAGAKVLHVRRPDEKDPDGAVWNFPMARAGKLTLRVLLQEGSAGGSVALGDRFFDPTDDNGEAKAIFLLPVQIGAKIGESAACAAGQWYTMDLQWDLNQSSCQVSVDGKPAAKFSPQNDSKNGVCYLRLRSAAKSVDPAGLLVESVNVEVQP